MSRKVTDERRAIDALYKAYRQLCDTEGWQSAVYAPAGVQLLLIEPGSTGVHTGHRDGDGFFWISDNHFFGGDLWPSHPMLFKPAITETP